jgi:hypothetical protein
MALDWRHAQVLLSELCEPDLLRLHILIVIEFHDILSSPRVCQPMEILTACVGVYRGSCEIVVCISQLVYDTCSAAGHHQSWKDKDAFARKQTKQK